MLMMERSDMLNLFKEPRFRRHRGQGMVEYAGALVIASFVVSLSLTILPDAFSDTFNEINDLITAFLMDYIPT